MTEQSKISWPEGGFEWTDDLKAELPIVRGIHVPEFAPPLNPPAPPPPFPGPDIDTGDGFMNLFVNAVASIHEPPATPRWTAEEAAEMLKLERLRNRSPEIWKEVMTQCALADGLIWWLGLQGHLPWATKTLVALHSVEFATESFLGAWTPQSNIGSQLAREAAPYLRHALAAAPETAYRNALKKAESFRGQSEQLDQFISFLFPDVAEWAEECAAQESDDSLIAHTALSVETACRYYHQCRIRGERAIPGALLQIHLHGSAALPILEQMLEYAYDKKEKLAALNLIVGMRTPDMMRSLVRFFDMKEARATLDKTAKQWPAACLLTALEHATTQHSKMLEDWILRLALRHPVVVESVLAECSDAARRHYRALTDAKSQVEDARPEDLPELLRNPPWTRKDRPKPLPNLELTAPEQPDEIVWPEGIRETWLNPESKPRMERYFERYTAWNPAFTRKTLGLTKMKIEPAAFERVCAGEPPRPEDFRGFEYRDWDGEGPLALLPLPMRIAQAVWDGVPPNIWASWDVSEVLRPLFAQRELEALPKLLEYRKARPHKWPALALPYRSAALAVPMAHVLRNLKQGRADAEVWLRAHSETAIHALIPAAFRREKAHREDAQYALRWYAESGFGANVHRIAANYGDAAGSAVDVLLATDPVWIVRARMPKLPAFFVAGSLARPVLKSGGALSLAAVENLGSMLAIGKLAEPYAGLESIEAACTPESLAAFAWDVFEAWLASGAPSKDSWAFDALGLLGDDAIARQLLPKIEEWLSATAYARAATALDILAAIGTEIAMDLLGRLTRRSWSKSIRDKARGKLADIAAARGLTEEELADRMVPTLDLNEQGSLELDFGPRRFVVSFDETLQPCVIDKAGARLKNLPKPLKSDDAYKADIATNRYKTLVKYSKAVARRQVDRMRKAMTGRRRWSPEAFGTLFLDHPLMRHLARRLVWGIYLDGEFTEGFRVAEDLSLADSRDETYAIPADTVVGIAMAAEMPESMRAAFRQIFTDYEIIQPFKQLDREVYALTDEERDSGEIWRFQGKQIAAGSLAALGNRGWVYVGGIENLPGQWLRKPADAGIDWLLGMTELNTASGGLGWNGNDRELGIMLAMENKSGNRIAAAQLSALAISEAIRDVNLLPAIKG